MFRKLTDRILVSPQITLDQVADAKAQGVTIIVNNRPDDEEPGQVNGAAIEAAAKAAGIAYFAVPVAHGGFAPWQLDGMASALAAGDLAVWGRADETFHRLLVERCGNGRFARIIQTVNDQSHRARMLTLRLRLRRKNRKHIEVC